MTVNTAAGWQERLRDRVTEYGIVNLQGKTQRERAEELISIAHPDHRAELRRAARGFFWP